jgi:MarR-like DNA-binding transcriptional regulator SgrR of sgrS sRNA
MSSGLLGRKPVQSITGSALGLERHYSVAEIAEMWALSEKTVRRMFEEEDGVLQWGTPETRRKRSYITLRIPESVLVRVHRKRESRSA